MKRMEWDVNQIRQWYCDEGLSSIKIAERTGYCKYAVLQFLHRHKIPVRVRSPMNRRKIPQGYIMIKKPEHPRANCRGFVPEHILIWETYHNKPVPKGYIIHHLNGIKDDNSPINLLALSDKKHWRLISALEKRIQELEANLRKQEQLL